METVSMIVSFLAETWQLKDNEIDGYMTSLRL